MATKKVFSVILTHKIWPEEEIQRWSNNDANIKRHSAAYSEDMHTGSAEEATALRQDAYDKIAMPMVLQNIEEGRSVTAIPHENGVFELRISKHIQTFFIPIVHEVEVEKEDDQDE